MRCVSSFYLKAAVFLICPALLVGQRGVPQTRIRQAINGSERKVLKGNIHPLAKSEFESGVAPQDLPMERMMLVLTRSAEQQSNLDQLLQELTDPASPRFHQWLTPEQFGQQFGASDQDIQTITDWLTAEGFHVERPMQGKTMLEFSGTAGQVANTFHTAIHKYTVNGEDHWANATDPEIPASLAPVVAGIATLHNFPKRPQSRDDGMMTGNAQLLSTPAFTSSTGGHALSPADFATIYSVNPVYQAGIKGLGATIAVVARSNFNSSDYFNFGDLFMPGYRSPEIIINGRDPGDLGGGEESEVVLDTTWASAVAPDAWIKVVISSSTNAADGVDLSEAYIINNNLADVMTESFSSCEAYHTGTQAAALSSLAAQAAAQGITYVVSTGDSGASECSAASSGSATGSLSVNVLAANPYVVAVGGTQFNDAAGGYWNATNDGNRGSAIAYIPENAWNESCGVGQQCGSSGVGLRATGGGASIFYPKPTWQSGVPGIPNDGARDIPDVSLAAAVRNPYLICLRGSCSSLYNRGFYGGSGTSASAPAFAGIMALIVQRTGSRQGQANVTLYRLAANQDMSPCNGSVVGAGLPWCIFHDITAGNNAVPGQASYGTPDAKYQTTVGYDLATGLGSVNVANLVFSWTTDSRPSGTPAVTLSATNVDFSVVSMGVTAKQTITLSNSGTANLAVGSIAIASDGAATFGQTNNCPPTIIPGGICSIDVTFLPRSAGQFNGTLGIVDDANGSPRTISLTGSGAETPTLTLFPAAVDFGSRKLQLRSETQTVQLANSTSQAISITGISPAGVNANDFSVASTCGGTLAPGQSCSVYVVFTPQLLGNRTASIVVTSSLPDSPHTVALTGTSLLSGAFEIANGLSGKVLDLVAGSGGNGTLVQQSPLTGQAQQQWIFYPIDNGFYYILNASTGKALDDTGASLSNGMVMQQWDYSGAIQQQWKLIATDDVHYAILNRGSGKVLDMTGASRSAGTLVQQWNANGSSQQSWVLVPAGSYELFNNASGIVLDAPSGSAANATPVQQYAPNGGSQQQWQFLPTGGGYYAILNRQSGKVLDVTSASLSNGALIQEYDFLNGANQQWRFDLVDGTYCKVVSRASGKVLDVISASMQNAAGIQQWDYEGTGNQLWQLSPLALYNIVNRASGQALEVPGGNASDALDIRQAVRTNSQQQRWQLLPVTGGYFAVVNDGTGKVLDVTSASTANAALIQQYRYLDGPNQQWQSISLSGGYYVLMNRESAKALDLVNASLSVGALIQQYRYQGGANQQWSLIPVAQ